MKPQMTIGALAQNSGVPGSTIRYYEREGLVRAEGRTSGNDRFFGRTAVDRLRFIRAAQASGLSLADIRALLEVRDCGPRLPARRRGRSSEARLRHVNEQVKHLRHVQRVLAHYQEECARTAVGTPCPVLEELGEGERRP
jgi:MerR family mercuric resistance operon transcriptional regulator